MAVDGQKLQGQITENPGTEKKDVEALLAGLLAALVKEQEETRNG
jgi:hypothetical protein